MTTTEARILAAGQRGKAEGVNVIWNRVNAE